MSIYFGTKTARQLLLFKKLPIAMAPRRSARVSAITQQAALDLDSIQEQPSTRAKKVQKAGVLAKKPTKVIKKQAGGKGGKSVSKAAAVAAAAATATAIANPASKTPHIPPPSTPKRPRTRPNPTSSPALNRPIDPHLTAATLLTPRGSHLTAYPANPEDASPSKKSLPRPTTTTGTLLEEATAHLLNVAPQLRPVVEKHPCPLFSPAGLAEEIDPFNSLVSGIIGQQVSGAAARSIKKKFMALFRGGAEGGNGNYSNNVHNNNNNANDVIVTTIATNTAAPENPSANEINSNSNGGDNESESEKPEAAEMRYDRDDDFPTPAQVAKCDIATLRSAGLSQRKAEYIQGLAEKFASGELSAQMLLQASDEEVLEKLIAVRGLGRWSVEMFSCFGLKRMDVFSTGDLGVQRGMAAFMGRDVSKLKAKGGGKFKYMSEKEMVDIAAPFSPYR
ncbi:DNA-3-methyladenine glycosylase [Histoplasma capsulatum G186AR]|uniref:DNA-3-methyladenine glycosylase n=1 Tax=Ajellomyces capsulatus TaxID=5037 RepID=A0A8H7ZAB2_AJECA|nr:DNA-3-methyladenine glycosylase [Histoplasma capsulatum]QSS69527.1 DNA-3-methyladenine glycosylase [Histoplasma capsulatum G186AR]